MNIEHITNSQIKDAIDDYVHSERDRGILFDRYVNGYTFERISEKYDMSTVQTKRIVYKQSEILSKVLN